MSKLAWNLIPSLLAVLMCLSPVAAFAGGAASPNAFGKPTADKPNPGSDINSSGAVRATRPVRYSQTTGWSNGWRDQTRSEAVGRNGMVSSSQPLATTAGLKILMDGGNAIDAAIATAATLALTEPQSTGLGAELFAIVWSAKDKKLYQVAANGWSPASWSLDYFAKRGMKRVPGSGPYSAPIPGSVDGWDQLLTHLGTMSFREVLEPAAQLAEDGFPITEILANSMRGSQNSFNNIDPDTKAIYSPNGVVQPMYSIFRNPDMAKTFRLLQKYGRDVFYNGEIAQAIVKKMNGSISYVAPCPTCTPAYAGSGPNGAEWALSDLSNYHAEWGEALTTNYHGYDIWETQAPSQAWAGLEMLNILDQCAPDLSKIPRGDPLFTHWQVEAKKLAYSDLHRFNSDPRFPFEYNGKKTNINDLLPTLLSKQYAKSLCPLIANNNGSAKPVRPADVKGNTPGGTVYFATADRWGNMVSMVYSVYTSWGSMVTIPGYGFQLSSRGSMFNLTAGSPNVVDGNKRPFITIIAGFVTQNGQPLMAFGNMGGSTQPQAHAQHMVNMIDLGYNLQASSDVARFDHDQESDTLSLDKYLFDAIGAALNAMPRSDGSSGGHKAAAGYGVGGGYQAILFERDPTLPEPFVPNGKGGMGQAHQRPVNGIYRAGSELRKDGMAAGF